MCGGALEWSYLTLSTSCKIYLTQNDLSLLWCHASAIQTLLSLIPFTLVIYYARQVDFRHFVTLIPSDYSSILAKENCGAIIDRHVQRLKAMNVNM